MSCNLKTHSERRFCCGGCQRAFSSEQAFDWHRRGRVCKDPAGGGWVPQAIPGVFGDVVVWGSRAVVPLGADPGEADAA